MNSITRQQRDELRILQAQQALSLQRVQGAALVARTTISELSKTHTHASSTVERTIATKHHLVESARCVAELPDERQAALERLTQTYLRGMLTITDETAAAIYDVLLSA